MFKWLTKRWEHSPLEKGMLESFKDPSRWEYRETRMVCNGLDGFVYYDKVLNIHAVFVPYFRMLTMHDLTFRNCCVPYEFSMLHNTIQKKLVSDIKKVAEALYANNS